jgi:hypothetical protein
MDTPIELSYREIYEVLKASFPFYYPLGEFNLYAVNAAEAIAALLESKGIQVKDDGLFEKTRKLRRPVLFK